MIMAFGGFIPIFNAIDQTEQTHPWLGGHGHIGFKLF
jgi:hypothetical protein